MLGKFHIVVLGELDIELILFVVTYAQAIAAKVAAASDGRSESVLVEIVGIKDIELGMYLFRWMGAKLQLAVDHVLHHLKHAILHLFGVV